MNWADYVREQGWEVGTVLIGDPITRNGKQIEPGRVIQITAIGREKVLAIRIDKASSETLYGFDSRTWREQED